MKAKTRVKNGVGQLFITVAWFGAALGVAILVASCQTVPRDDYKAARETIPEDLRAEIGEYIFGGEYQRQMAAAAEALRAREFAKLTRMSGDVVEKFESFQTRLGEYSDLVALWKMIPLYHLGESLYWDGDRSERVRVALEEAVGIALRMEKIAELWKRTGGGVTDETAACCRLPRSR